MPKFMLAYHGGNPPKSAEAGAELMGAMMAWHKGHGSATVDIGAPLGTSMTVGSDGVTSGGGANPVSGYTIVQADTLDAAVALTESCPLLGISATIEVAQIMEQ